jgi:predicted porin
MDRLGGGGDDEIYQVYASYQLTNKSTLNGRYEWGTSDEHTATNVKSLGVGLSYDLWENVISRVEYLVTSVDLVNDDKTLAINLIYSF